MTMKGILNLRKFKKVIQLIKKIPLIRNVMGIIITNFAFPKKNLNDSLKGYTAYVYDASYVNEKDFQEPHIIKFFKDHIRKNMVVFDIGAHFGYFTLLSRKLVGEAGEVISFEPSPIPLNYLRKNIKINKFKNVFAEPLMVSDREDNFNLYYSGFGGTMSSFKKSPDLPYKKKVLSVSLDKYCLKRNLHPDFIKIDVEGADLLVIKGLKRTLSTKNIEILLELHHNKLSKQEIKELIRLVRESHYKVYAVFPNQKGYIIKNFNFSDLPGHIFITKKAIKSLI
jgi:FkbM family methyltransferase